MGNVIICANVCTSRALRDNVSNGLQLFVRIVRIFGTDRIRHGGQPIPVQRAEMRIEQIIPRFRHFIIDMIQRCLSPEIFQEQLKRILLQNAQDDGWFHVLRPRTIMQRRAPESINDLHIDLMVDECVKDLRVGSLADGKQNVVAEFVTGVRRDSLLKHRFERLDTLIIQRREQAFPQRRLTDLTDSHTVRYCFGSNAQRVESMPFQ